MGTTMNREAYEKMIREDLEWLERQPHSLERMHIIEIVRHSADHYYPAAAPAPDRSAAPTITDEGLADELFLVFAARGAWIVPARIARALLLGEPK